MRLDKVSEILEATPLAGQEHLASEVHFGCASDLMSDVLAFSLPDGLLLTGLTTIQVIYTAEMAALKAVCFVRGKKPPEEALALARARGILVMSSGLPMFECCGRLHAEGLRGCRAPDTRDTPS
jgi:hypothetical protein